ncbi:hypothetical protein BS17DRAFT_462793 [Gyrodon lividus]|nr:hypothetical protein BS17DRAFT_462793 [Gyrodon lividus]
MNTLRSPYPRRTTTIVVIELARNQALPSVPLELQGHFSPVVWDNRLRSIIEIASRFSNPMYERIYILISVILATAVPIMTHYLLEPKYPHNINSNLPILQPQNPQVPEWEVLIFGVTVGTWLLVFVPFAVWKNWGSKRIRKLVLQWQQEDARGNTSYVNIPPWTVTTPGILRESIVMRIVVPALSVHSLLHLTSPAAL